MNGDKMYRLFFLIAFCCNILLLRAQDLKSKPALDFKALDNWISLGNNNTLSINKDGKYFAYTIINQPYQSKTLVIQSTADSWQQLYPGAEAGFFSGDGKQYVFRNGGKLNFVQLGNSSLPESKDIITFKHLNLNKDEYIAYQVKNDCPTLLLRIIKTKEEVRFDSVKNYSFDKSGNWLILESNNVSNDLIVYNLLSGRTKRFKWISDYVFSDDGRTAVLKRTQKETTIQFIDLFNNQTIEVWNSEEGAYTVNGFTLDASGQQLALLVNKISTDVNERINNESKNSIWYWKVGMDKALLRVADQINDITLGSFIGDMRFSSDGRYLYIDRIKYTEKLKFDKGVELDVWSYKDSLIQTTQLEQLNNSEKPQGFVIACSGGNIVPIWNYDEELRTNQNSKDFVVVSKTGRQAYGDRFWDNKFREDSNWLVSLQTGKRKLLQTKVENGFWFSPGGDYLVYFDKDRQCNYFSYNLHTGKEVNISSSVPAYSLGAAVVTQRPRKAPKFRAGAVGWLREDEGFLVYDDYDIWKLDPSGRKSAVNLTNGYGRKTKNKLRVSGNENSDIKLPIYKEQDTLLLKTTNMITQYNGFHRKDLSTVGNPEKLCMGPYVFEMAVWSNQDMGMRPLKATDANVWIVKKQNFDVAPNYFLTRDFKYFKQLTSLQPHKAYNWFKAELHSFKQLDGTISQGILYKPENFDSSKKYPVIIGFYNRYSQRLHQYLKPEYLYQPIIDGSYLISQGYLVFTPDIYFDGIAWGKSAFNTIEGAAQYLRKLKYIDKNGIAASGHSHSGHLAFYVLTHSNSFAAMSIGSATIDLVSSSLSLDFAYKGESRLSANDPLLGNIWNNKKAWLAESPIMHLNKASSPLLMMYNKQDVVPNQAIEAFIALRRLEKKVWWLQYDKGDHVVGPDYKDFTIRTTQFYDHYLKGTPAPKWMTQGIPAKFKAIESRYELDPSGSCDLPDKKECKVCKKWNEQYKKTPEMFTKPLSEWHLDEKNE